MYDIPLKDRAGAGTKHTLTGTTDLGCPTPKKSKQDSHALSTTHSMKQKKQSVEAMKSAKRMRCSRDSVPTVSPLKFHPVTEQWQRNICAQIGLEFHGKNRVRPGGPNVSLTPPDMRTVKHIMADGNCLFRSLAYIYNNRV